MSLIQKMSYALCFTFLAFGAITGEPGLLFAGTLLWVIAKHGEEIIDKLFKAD